MSCYVPRQSALNHIRQLFALYSAVVSDQALSAEHIVTQYVLLNLLQTSRSQSRSLQPRKTHHSPTCQKSLEPSDCNEVMAETPGGRQRAQ